MVRETLADGRYLLGEVLGTGGMADVHRAQDTRLERDVAVKLFRAGAAEGIERGSAEARMLAGLHHPGLVRVLDMDSGASASAATYLVMELVEGPDLGALLRGGPLSGARTRQVGWDVARTLGYIHQRGIIHRDIKPSNILTREAEPDSGMFGYLLTDFGIARFFDGSRMTATGQTIGTAAYFSPEQARGGALDTPTDIYSLGLVLLECLTGERAFPGTGLESALARLSRAPSIPEALGERWVSLLSSMTADDPAGRPSAAAVAGVFAGWNAQESSRTQVMSAAAAPTTRVENVAAARPQLSLPETAPVARPRLSLPEPPPVLPGPGAPENPTATSPLRATARRPATGAEKKRAVPWGMTALILGGLAALVVVAFLLATNRPAAPAEPLPDVPGITGEVLDELYESVQP